MKTLILLIAGHYLGDFGLQSDFIAQNKYGSPVWKHVMTAHCAIQAGTVMLATSHWELAVTEFVIHFMVDVLKCKGWISFNVDQAIHIVCRIAYALITDYWRIAL